MIVKKVWTKKFYSKLNPHRVRETQDMEGWYLLGLIPLYVRPTGPVVYKGF